MGLSDDLFFSAIICGAVALVLAEFFRSFSPENTRAIILGAIIAVVLLLLIVLVAKGWLERHERARAAAKRLVTVLCFLALCVLGYILDMRLENSEMLLVIILAVILVYLTIAIHSAVLFALQRRASERTRREQKALQRNEILAIDPAAVDVATLQLTLENIDQFFSGTHDVQLTAQRRRLLAALDERRHEQKIGMLRSEQERLTRTLENLEKARREAEMSSEEFMRELAHGMNIYEESVFRKDGLSDEQVALLRQEGFVQVNEYCVAAQCLVTAFVRPVLQHSSTHTFLVWSVKQALENIADVSNVVVHHTRDADLTFKIGEKLFALEIETGSLLKKKRQIEEKAIALRKRYGRRWLIIVSNKLLAPKYRRYGVVATRKDAVAKIEGLIAAYAYPK